MEEDHERAKAVGKILEKAPFVKEVLPITTNIVIARLSQISPESFLDELTERNIWAVMFGRDQIRMVTHMDFTDQHLEAFESRIKRWEK